MGCESLTVVTLSRRFWLEEIEIFMMVFTWRMKNCIKRQPEREQEPQSSSVGITLTLWNQQYMSGRTNRRVE
jgi:hypothetical protein